LGDECTPTATLHRCQVCGQQEPASAHQNTRLITPNPVVCDRAPPHPLSLSLPLRPSPAAGSPRRSAHAAAAWNGSAPPWTPQTPPSLPAPRQGPLQQQQRDSSSSISSGKAAAKGGRERDEVRAAGWDCHV
jgi:hypothetical protein